MTSEGFATEFTYDFRNWSYRYYVNRTAELKKAY